MQQKPKADLLMTPSLQDALLDEATKGRLSAVCDWQPVGLPLREDARIILASWGTPVLDANLLNQLPHLEMVAYAAGSIKPIVTDTFWDRNIIVSSAAAANAIAVAEYTVATMVFMAKSVQRIIRDYVDDDTSRFERLHGAPRGFNGLNIGLVGASHVGREVMRLLASYDVVVAVCDPYLTSDDAEALGVMKMELDELVSWADCVSLHAPQLPETAKMIGRKQLGLMKYGSYFINTARGTLVDYEALAEIAPQKAMTVMLDVTDPAEPLPANHPLRRLENVTITPHIAGSRGNEQQRLGALAVAEIERFVSNRPLLHRVRREDLPRIA